MKTTERLGLALPEGSDFVNIETLNENFRKLDAQTKHAAQHSKDGNDPITPESIGAAATGHNHDNTYSKTSHTHTAASIGAVPTTRTVNGRALSSDITLAATDVGAAVTATYNVTITASSWAASGSYYYQDISVPGMLATDNPIPGVAYGADNDANVTYDECFAKVLHITTSANSIRVWATEAIETAFPIQMKVVR